MAINPQDIGAVVSNFGIQMFGNIGQMIGQIFLGLLIGGIFILIYFYTSYNIKVEWRYVYGDPQKEGKPYLSKTYKDRGKFIKQKGVPKFALLKANRKIKEIPSEYTYPDGVYLLRFGKDTFVPTARPMLNSEKINLTPLDADLKFWATLELQDLQQRFQDDELRKRAMWVTLWIIVAILVFVGVVIWLTYNYNMSGLAQTESVVSRLDQLLQKVGASGAGPG